MKEFRKTEDDKFICEECNRTFERACGLGVHIKKTHKIELKIYYDKWINEDDENLCKICGKELKFTGMFWGYRNTCDSTKCKRKYNLIRTEEEVFKKYGVKSVFELIEIKEKSKQTMIKKYGVEYAGQSEEIKKKKVETCLENNGVKYPQQSEKIREKGKITCKEKYGVEYNVQNKEIHEKQLKSGYRFKRFKDTDIWYQGSFEFDFLEKHLDKFPNILRGPSIKYI